MQHVQVDLDAVHTLHAADVRVTELFDCVQKRARALDTGRGIDHLVAVHLAAAAFELVLGPERKLRDRDGREALRLRLHDGIVVPVGSRRKT